MKMVYTNKYKMIYKTENNLVKFLNQNLTLKDFLGKSERFGIYYLPQHNLTYNWSENWIKHKMS